MASIGTALRRTLLFVVLAAAVGVALSWRRSHLATPTPSAPPQWPDWPESTGQPEKAEPSEPATQAAPTDGAPSWVPANADGSAPDTHPVKAKTSSGIFHLPGGRFYDRTKADRCYPTAAAAEMDGYRQSKS